MGIRHIHLPRPEAGAERDAVFYANHGCSQGRALRASMGDDVDLVRFGVGTSGAEMPLNIPFEVAAGHPCPACGAWLRILVTWTGPKIWLPLKRVFGRWSHR